VGQRRSKTETDYCEKKSVISNESAGRRNRSLYPDTFATVLNITGKLVAAAVSLSSGLSGGFQQGDDALRF
jgi:hypothetical protein